MLLFSFSLRSRDLVDLVDFPLRGSAFWGKHIVAVDKIKAARK